MDITKRTLTGTEESVLLHQLTDVNEWVVGALDGKINTIKKRMVEEARQVLYADESVTQIPASDDEIIGVYVARSDYKNRAERDEKNNPKPE
jgi:hypothetical protein